MARRKETMPPVIAKKGFGSQPATNSILADLSHIRLVQISLCFTFVFFLILYPGFSQGAQNANELGTLIRKYEKEDVVPVIIKFNTAEQSVHSASAATSKNHSIIQRALLSKLAFYHPEDVKTFKHLPLLAMKIKPAALKAFLSDPAIAGIYEDRLSYPMLAQSTPLIGADNAVASGYGGQGQTIAILDTGIDKTHPFLANKIIHEACFSSTVTSQGSTSVCPNGQNTQIGPGAGVPCSGSIAGCNHGTHVAGIAAGKGSGFSGVAREASIMAIQIFSRFTGSGNCGNSSVCALSYTSDQIRALEYVYSQRDNFNIAAVNMSLGGGEFASACDDDPRKAAIDLLRSAGIATIVSSGNDAFTNSVSAPACISTAISVGSTTKSDQISSFSNSVSFLDLLAPGTGITSSVPGGSFASFSGTSMAAPHVAGAFAILKSRMPTASVSQIEHSLKSTGIGVVDTRNGINKPRISVDSALAVLIPPSIPTLLVSPENGLLITGPDGGPFTPAGQTYTLTNNTSSGQSLSFSVTTTANWLQLSTGSGSILPGGKTTITATIKNNVANTLPIGTYEANITFSNLTNGAGNTTINTVLVISGDNDFFNNATPIGQSGINSGSTQGNNTNASLESGEPNHAKKDGNKSVWWKWTAPANGSMQIQTCGSNFDTVLGIYTGTIVNALSEVTSNDDGCDLQSSASFEARAGVTYSIAVDGYNGAAGDIVLSWNFSGGSVQSPGISVVPATDITFTGASSGPFTPTNAVYTVTNVSTITQSFNIKTPPWLSASLNNFELVPGNSVSITFTIDSLSQGMPPGIYSGIIDFGFTARAVILNLTSGSLSNDDFSNALPIQGKVYSISWNNNLASKEAGEPAHAGNMGGKSVWWKWTATDSGPVTIDTEGSTFDTILGAYTGNNVSQLTEIASDDDSGTGLLSRIMFSAIKGRNYYIVVDGYNGRSGNLRLNLLLSDNRQDFNGDGKSDTLWRHALTGTNMIKFMDSFTVTSSNVINAEPDLHWKIAGTGDFNGDGKEDILWRHALSGVNWIYFMNGSTIIASSMINTEPDLHWKIVGTGDFNGDGNDDILWRHEITGDNWLYLMNGSTIISNIQINKVADPDWKIAGVGDFNADGKDDILWRHRNYGRVWLYLMDSENILSSQHVAFTGMDWDIKALGDFNADGKEDILWRNSNHGRVWAFMMNGSSILTSQHIAYTSLDWEIKASGDYDGDGKTDIFWRNRVSGQNWIYLMNGIEVKTENNAGSVPDLNWYISR